MSLTVEHGFRFRTDDLREVHRLLMAYRPEIRRLSRELDARLLAAKAVSIIDRAILAGVASGPPLSLAWDKVFDRRRGIARGEPAPEVDQGFLVAVLPWEGRIYGSVHTWRREWASDLLGQPWAEPYDYTDACDQDEVPRDEYDARGETWQGIARQDPGWRLSGCGFRVEFLPDVGHIPPDEILAVAPDVASRARNAARDAVIEARAAGMRAEGADPMHAAIQACLWYAEPEGRECGLAEAARIAPLLTALDVRALTEGFSPRMDSNANPGIVGGT